ncbi:MAG: four helix bundle protein [Clostridiales bacterium]|nr:four helix bundle protein [Clostridiales bacterium]
MSDSKLRTQSMDFAVQIINLVKSLKEKRESIISNQIGRSGTSIAANDTDGSISLYSNESNLTVGIKTDNYAKWEFIPDTEYTSMENYYAGINFSFPLPNSSSSYNFDTGYGNRWWTSLNNNIPQRHMGMDICANSGTVLKSAANGEVVCIGNSSSGGNYIIIECSNIYVYNTNIKLRFAYFHMNQASSLNVGDNVTTNTVVGYVGNTGTSSEPHLHMAIITNGGNSATNYNYTIDPLLLYNGYSFNFIRK